MSEEMLLLAQRMRAALAKVVLGESVTLAIDGGKIHRKLQSLSIVVGKKAYYLRSIPVCQNFYCGFYSCVLCHCPQVLHNDNSTIYQVLEDGKNMVETMGGEVVAVVGDNHSGLQLGIDKLVEKHPRIFKLRCAAHSFQACPTVCPNTPTPLFSYSF